MPRAHGPSIHEQPESFSSQLGILQLLRVGQWLGFFQCPEGMIEALLLALLILKKGFKGSQETSGLYFPCVPFLSLKRLC